MGDDKTYLCGKAIGGKGVTARLGTVALEEGVGKITRKEKARVDSLKLENKRLLVVTEKHRRIHKRNIMGVGLERKSLSLSLYF